MGDKRWLTSDTDDVAIQEDDDHTEGEITRDAELHMLGDVLLDILDELCQMHELLRQRSGTMSQA